MLRSRFLWKLYASYAVIIVLLAIVVGAVICQEIQRDARREIEESLRARAALLGPIAFATLKGAPGPLSEELRALGQETGTRLTVIAVDGRVLADSDELPTDMSNHFDRPEVVGARATGQGVETRFSETLAMEMIYVASAVYDGGEIVGYVRTSLSVSTIDRRISYVQNVMAMWVGLAAVVSLGVAFIVARHVVAPVSSMTALAESMAEGEYEARLPVSRRDELGQLGEAMNRMAQSCHEQVSELRRLERIRRDFVANASHELKTPITAMRGMLETMIEDTDMSPQQRERFLTRTRDQSVRLAALVSDLLALSRLESHDAQEEQGVVTLRQVLVTCEQVLQAAAEKRGVALSLTLPEHPVMVAGDEIEISHVVSNLLDNAINYTLRGGGVELRLGSESGVAILEVTDTGVGIASEHLDRIFERFYRVDKARSRELGGTGLGLAIVKHIVLTHGGTISVSSTLGEGSTFRVELPLAGEGGIAT
jgi:signal transduction histidine kinase